MKLQEIPICYSHANRKFILEKRNKLAALYKCTDGKTGYEVFRIRVVPASWQQGSFLPEREILANITEWGEFGWSYLLKDYKGALRKFNSL